MPIKKGDLVAFTKQSYWNVNAHVVKKLVEAGGCDKAVFMVIKNPHEIYRPVAKVAGKVYSSEITVGVDLLFEGKILKDIPIQYLKRVEKIIDGDQDGEIKKKKKLTLG